MNTLPSLNVLRARSTYVLLAAILSYFAPELAALINPDAMTTFMGPVLDHIDGLGTAILAAWAWYERKNPGRRLSLTGGWKD